MFELLQNVPGHETQPQTHRRSQHPQSRVGVVPGGSRGRLDTPSRDLARSTVVQAGSEGRVPESALLLKLETSGGPGRSEVAVPSGKRAGAAGGQSWVSGALHVGFDWEKHSIIPWAAPLDLPCAGRQVGEASVCPASLYNTPSFRFGLVKSLPDLRNVLPQRQR